MGIYVQIQRTSSNGKISKYMFSNGIGKGEFSVNESSGKIDYYEKMPNDSKNLHFSRAAYKVIKYWQETGTLPEKETWAS
ncbi:MULTISPECIES: hypothetical protein [Enterobacter cloacae complex]|uniref:hypothetical protein n=1 Tax=Enterobacter cloacae complex TaxID=354276 RepID=UPI0012581683|nr:hypothetical protein [Enterobacter hormaechei]EHN8719220.1 hypothetical protein [Enterobacter hormaechei]MCM7180012.1 hypothetical protein [Enterobacter hormaechei]MDO6165533.1 hypothetical protein [Enterobacter hormaechei]MDO6169800.1 hypothetical protein [Enterobacter hormaechei]WDT16379.1 hypothetical protein LNGFDJGK_02250 [Enterobacter hormaechei]